jgi:hypothetical protein
MAKLLSFSIGNEEFTTEPIKIDRKKLYGWREVHAFDDDGNECMLVSTDASGTTIIPKGGISLGIESHDGKWVERSRIKTVNIDGSDRVMTPSSYSQVNTLAEKVTNEAFLDCSITSFYYLANSKPELLDAIGDDIYKLNYCYRDSYDTDSAFLLVAEVNSKKELFMFVGTPNEFEFIGLNEIVAEELNDDDEEESDDIDFGML